MAFSARVFCILEKISMSVCYVNISFCIPFTFNNTRENSIFVVKVEVFYYKQAGDFALIAYFILYQWLLSVTCLHTCGNIPASCQ